QLRRPKRKPRPKGDLGGAAGAYGMERATVPEFILVQASANPCKTLQSASICFKAPCKKMQYFAIECFEMLHFVSFTPVHLWMTPPAKIRIAANQYGAARATLYYRYSIEDS